MIVLTSRPEPIIQLRINIPFLESRYITIECPEGLAKKVLNFAMNLIISQIQTNLSSRPLKNWHLTLSYVPRSLIPTLNERLLTPSNVNCHRALLKNAPHMESLRWSERGVRFDSVVDVIEYNPVEEGGKARKLKLKESVPIGRAAVMIAVRSLKMGKHCPITYLTRLFPILQAIADALERKVEPEYQKAKESKAYILTHFDDVFALADPTILCLTNVMLAKSNPDCPKSLKSHLFHKESLYLLAQNNRQYRVSVPKEGSTLASIMNQMMGILKSNIPMTLYRYQEIESCVPDIWKIAILLQLIDSYIYNVSEKSEAIYSDNIQEMIKYILIYEGPEYSSIFLTLKRAIIDYSAECSVDPLEITKSDGWPYFIDYLISIVSSLPTRSPKDTKIAKRQLLDLT